MTTTAFVVELLVIGMGALGWVAFLILAIFGYSWTQAVRIDAPLLLIPGLSVTYVLGILTDRLADRIFQRWAERLRRQRFDTPDEYVEVRTRIYMRSKGLRALYEYNRSRLRICRGWAVNAALVAVTFNLFVWLRVPDASPRLQLSLFATVAGAILVTAAWSVWRNMADNEYRNLALQGGLLSAVPGSRGVRGK